MVNTYKILFKKNGIRVTPSRLRGADARIFQLHLKRLSKGFEDNHTDVLDNIALLVAIDGEEHYRKRDNLKKKEILTIDDMIIDYELNNITHILVDGILTKDKNTLLDNIYVLELFSESMYQSPQLDAKLRKR